jgi:hypothetical protein
MVTFMSGQAKVVFDEGHARKLFAELAIRLKAFDSFESVPEHVRSVLKECLAGRGFEFAYTSAGAALSAGEGLVKIRIAGNLEGALATLRAMQGDDIVSHA